MSSDSASVDLALEAEEKAVPAALSSAPGYKRVGQPLVLIRNVAMNFFAQGWTLLITFFTTPYIVHHFGDDAYGILSVQLVLLSYFWFFNRSLGSALVKYVSEAATKPEKGMAARVICSGVFIALVIIFAGSALQLGLATWFATRLFRIPAHLQSMAAGSFLIGVGIFASKVLCDIFEAILQARQRFDISNGINTVFLTAQKLLIVLLLALGFKLHGILFMMCIVGAASLVAFYCAVQRILPFPMYSRPDWAVLRSLLRYSNVLAVGSALSIIATNADKLFLSIFSPISEMTYYMVAFNLASLVLMIPGNVASVLFAAFSESHALGEYQRIQRFISKGTEYLMAGVMPLSSTLLVFGDIILGHWMGPQFAAKGTLPLRIFAVASVPATVGWVALVAAQAFGRPDIPTKTHAVQAATNIVLCVWLIPRLGVTGAALSWAVNHFIANIILVSWVNVRLVHLRILAFFRASLARPLLLTLLLMPLALALRPFAQTLQGLLVCLGIFVSVNYLAGYFVILEQAEREQLKAFALRRSALKTT